MGSREVLLKQPGCPRKRQKIQGNPRATETPRRVIVIHNPYFLESEPTPVDPPVVLGEGILEHAPSSSPAPALAAAPPVDVPPVSVPPVSAPLYAPLAAPVAIELTNLPPPPAAAPTSTLFVFTEHQILAQFKGEIPPLPTPEEMTSSDTTTTPSGTDGCCTTPEDYTVEISTSPTNPPRHRRRRDYPLGIVHAKCVWINREILDVRVHSLFFTGRGSGVGGAVHRVRVIEVVGRWRGQRRDVPEEGRVLPGVSSHHRVFVNAAEPRVLLY